MKAYLMRSVSPRALYVAMTLREHADALAIMRFGRSLGFV